MNACDCIVFFLPCVMILHFSVFLLSLISLWKPFGSLVFVKQGYVNDICCVGHHPRGPPGLKTTRRTPQTNMGHNVPHSPFLSISHMKSSQGMKPTGPHSTNTAMSDLEKPNARTAEFWMGPQKFHTIPCMNPSRENKHRTSHLLPYTRLWTGWPFVVGRVGVRRGSLSASVLGPAPIAAVWGSARFGLWFLWQGSG